MDPIGFVLIGLGGFCLSGAIFDWDWFMNARKARIIVRLISRGGARIFYGCIGLFVLIVGILTLAGVIQSQS